MDVMQAQRLRVGAQIRKARKGAGLSHDRLGAMVGTSRQHLIRLEKGDHAPRAEMLAKIAEATGKPEAFFTGDSDDEEESRTMPSQFEMLEALRPLKRLLALVDA